MSRNNYYTLAILFAMLPAFAGAEQPPSPPKEKATPPSVRQGAAAAAEQGALSEGPYGPGTIAVPNPGSAFSNEPTIVPITPSTALPLSYSASRSQTALRVEDLMRGAAALRTEGEFSKAMDLYNEAITIAPQYAEAYRQRALTLARLGDRVQAQIDYNRFLSIDPQASDRMREEVTLFEQSGQALAGEAAAAAYSYGGMPPVIGAIVPPAPVRSPQQLADQRFTWAQDAFQRGDYDSALQWAQRSSQDMPQARTRALLAQILFALGDFRSAAAEARAAAAMAPVMDWRTLFSYYGYMNPRFSRQFHALEEFVRKNPSSADAHFLLGYEQLILGHAQPAHAQLAIAAVLEPTDVVATNLLAKDGVEIVSAHRPGVQAAQGAPARGTAEVARRPTTPPLVPAPIPVPPPAPSQPEVTR